MTDYFEGLIIGILIALCIHIKSRHDRRMKNIYFNELCNTQKELKECRFIIDQINKILFP
jgi:hypothetical protein